MERFPRMSFAAATHSAVTDDPTVVCVCERSPWLEDRVFACLESTCPIENRAIYDFFDTIRVPSVRLTALRAALARNRALAGFVLGQRVQRVQALYDTLQELRRNRAAQDVLGVDLDSLTVPQLEEIFRDRSQKVRIEQKVDLYLASVIDSLVRRREALQGERLALSQEGAPAATAAWCEEQLAQVKGHIDRLEDIKAMIPYDLYACLFLSRTSGLRKEARALARSRPFNAFIFCCIVLNVFTQCFESPYLPGPPAPLPPSPYNSPSPRPPAHDRR